MYLAHGHYVKIQGLNAEASISAEKAAVLFAEYKSIPKDSIIDFIHELLIKEIPSTAQKDATPLPKLVYRVYLLAKYAHNDEVGLVDAHTGEVVATEPRVLNYSATGTFYTRYNDTRSATTQFYNNVYNLCDSSRYASGGPVIHTWNLDGGIYFHHAVELTDEDNIWTTSEFYPNGDDIGLDIHWALQEIVDYLNDVHNLNSFDDQGLNIDAYFHFYTNYEGAGYDPYFYVLFFGDGENYYRPLASLDVIAHEFGHGITHFQIDWPLTGDPLAFHEGLSDIWAVILENRINPNSIWQIGEQITINNGCVRNIAEPSGNNPEYAIADTYQSTYYNANSEPHIRGGVFSRWFYLLVNGGSGTNGIDNDYTVYGIGMDAAEELIVYAVLNNFLDNTSTYPDIRQAMVDAAEAIFVDTIQVANAWYAVGVGPQPVQTNISGPSLVCSSGTVFTVNNVPANATIEWSNGSNITRSSAQGSNPFTFTSTGYGSSWVKATLVMDYTSIPLQKNVTASSAPHDLDLYCEGGYGGPLGSYPLWVSPFYYGDIISWGSSPAADITDLGGGYASIYFNTPSNYTIWAYTDNGCGTGDTAYTYFYAYELLMSPNPASTEVEITISDGQTEELKSARLSSDDEFTVTILDNYGIAKIQKNYFGKKLTVPVSSLKEGNYFVKINNSKMAATKQLIIKR